MTKGHKSFVKGAAILGGAGLLVKFIGAIFRIPLTNIIGADGMANYQVAYPVYATLVVIATAGLPAAISKMVAERVTVGDYRGAHKVFQTALKVLFLVGVVSTGIMLALSGVLADAANIPTAKLGLMLISPSLFFVAILSSYRGYFQGLQMMSPTALTQIVEQVIKLGAGLYLASLWISKGFEYGAAGALLGVTISEVFALIVIIFIYNRKKGDIKEKRKIHSKTPITSSFKSTAKELLRYAIPITIGGSIMPIVAFLDTLIVTNKLAAINYSAYNILSPTTSFGVLTGTVNPLINMPAVLSLALCMSLVPAISEARAEKNPLEVGKRSAMGFKLAVLIGLPSAIGMFLLAEPIISMLYSAGLSAAELEVGAQLLKISAIGVLFLTLLQTMTGVLQGAGKVHIPLINLAVGASVKVILSLILIGIPSLNINGAAIGTAACYGIASMLNVLAVIRVAKPKIQLISGVIMPLLSSAAMGLVVYLMHNSLSSSLGNTTATIISIAGAMLVYLILLFITGAIKSEDMEFIPGGSTITRLMRKLDFWE